MKHLMILILLFTIMSCSDNEEMAKASFVLDSQVTLAIINQNGDDLLNPATSNYFSLENMKLYYLVNDEKIEIYDPNMAYPRNIGLITETTPYTLGVATYDGDEDLISEENGVKTGISIAYLKLNENITDTIKTQWESKEGEYFVNRKAWYNGELKSVEEPFIIIK